MPARVRYIVSDIEAAIGFYVRQLGFKVDMHPSPGFASLSRGDLQLLLNRPARAALDKPRPTGSCPRLEAGIGSRSKSRT
jgi:catechol 2,3-dioxygenase-like lactoylglutathione lyase family enzyme